MVFPMSVAIIYILLACYLPISAERPLQIRRNKRSLLDLNEMIQRLTGRSGTDFIGYGNFCGLGGKGKPVDDIDRCCEMHDICYDVARNGACASDDANIVYTVKYDWQQKRFGPQCSLDQSRCMMAVCNCDARLAECLKNYIYTYKKSNKHETDLQDLLNKIQQITQ